MGDFDGTLAVVLGGASGIGAATAARLRSDGAEVVVADRTPLDGATVVDVTDESAVVALFADLERAPGVVVNCAGVNGHYGPLAGLSLSDWQATIDVNLTGSFLCTREAAKAMSESGGSIVNVSSGAGMRGFANLPDYVASKHGVIGLTRAAALEYARAGIRVNAVAPGTVRTPMLEGFVGGDEASLAGMAKITPAGRLGTPDEIAAAIVWLSSPDAAFMNGAVIAVDGGVSAA